MDGIAGAPPGHLPVLRQGKNPVVHYLRHEQWKGDIAVGRICAGLLTGDRRKADDEEAQLRNRAQRRLNFPKLAGWRTSAKGNAWIEYHDRHIIVMPSRNGTYRLRIDGKLGKLDFPDERSAMLRAFDVVTREMEKERSTI